MWSMGSNGSKDTEFHVWLDPGSQTYQDFWFLALYCSLPASVSPGSDFPGTPDL